MPSENSDKESLLKRLSRSKVELWNMLVLGMGALGLLTLKYGWIAFAPLIGLAFFALVFGFLPTDLMIVPRSRRRKESESSDSGKSKSTDDN